MSTLASSISGVTLTSSIAALFHQGYATPSSAHQHCSDVTCRNRSRITTA